MGDEQDALSEWMEASIEGLKECSASTIDRIAAASMLMSRVVMESTVQGRRMHPEARETAQRNLAGDFVQLASKFFG